MDCQPQRIIKALFLIIFSIIFSMPPSAFSSDVFQELLSCQKTSNGEHKLHCAIKKVEFASKQDYESTLVVDYNFSCKGSAKDSDIKNIGIRAEDSQNFHAFDFGKKGQATVTGFGPFVLYDSDPGWTSFIHLSKDCSLKISNFQTIPSKRTLDIWRQTLIDVNAIVESLEHLVNYKAAYSFMKDLTSMFHSELTSEKQLSLSTIGKDVVTMIPVIIQKYAMNPTPESQNTITTLVRFMTVLNDFKSESNWKKEDGTRKKVEDFLSKKDKEILEKISKDGLSIKDAKEKLEDALKRKVALEAKLKHYSKDEDVRMHDEL